MRYRRIPNLGKDYLQTIERINILERIVQAIGFTPDFPYTLNVNDGTRNRVEIGKINGDYGIRIVNNAGVEIVFADGHISATGITTGTLDASKITVTNLSASSINTGTLDCSLLTVTNLSADSITTGTLNGENVAIENLDASNITTGNLSADRVSGGTLDFDNISVAHLSADYITAGTLNAITISLNGCDLSGYLGVGGANQPTYLTIARDDSSGGNAYLRWAGGSKMWSDTSNRIGINSLGSPMYIYVDSNERIVINSSGQNLIRGGLQVTADGGSGNVNIEGDTRINEALYMGESGAGYLYFDGTDWQLEANLRVNGYITLRSTLWMNWHDIWEADNIKANNFDTYSAVFEGKDYKSIINSIIPDKKKIKTDRVKKMGKDWEELDHDSLHPSLYREDKKGGKGMSLTSLIMVHNTAIQDLISRVENLEKGK